MLLEALSEWVHCCACACAQLCNVHVLHLVKVFMFMYIGNEDLCILICRM